MYDVAVIGGGVIGGAVLRELTKYQLKVCLLEQHDDVCMGQSKANSGIVHAGFDASPNSLKAKFNVLGANMMKDYASELGVKYVNNGSLVLAFSDEELKTLEELKNRGEINGVKELRIISKEEVKALEVNVSDECVGALIAPTAGIVCPYSLTIASIGNAMDNGADLHLNFKVSGANKVGDSYEILSDDGKKVLAKTVINCSGIGGGKVSEIFGDDTVKIGGRKGDYILLDREVGSYVKHTLFCTPTEKGKGILVSPTAHGNIILGPTATVVSDDKTDTTKEGLDEVKTSCNSMCKNVPLYASITSFSGVRAYSDRHDFVIEQSNKNENLINCIGIESPGLTSAPAIGKFVVEELVSKRHELKTNDKFNGKRTPDDFFSKMSMEEKNELIKKDSSFGKIICRCETITEGEIIHAITANPPARNMDAVKRRTRAGMGRCQGGFCSLYVSELISKYQNIPFTEVTKSGRNSQLVKGKTK